MSHLDIDTATGRQVRRRRYTLLDGIDSQAGSSKPTVRSDGTALATGDRWLDTGDRMWWYWSGTYWLSEQIHRFIFGSNTTFAATGFFGGFRANPSYNLYLINFSVNATFPAGTYDASNKWHASLVRDQPGIAGNTVESTLELFQGTVASNSQEVFNTSLNLHRDVSSLNIARYRVNLAKTGSPASISLVGGEVTWRLAKL